MAVGRTKDGRIKKGYRADGTKVSSRKRKAKSTGRRRTSSKRRRRQSADVAVVLVSKKRRKGRKGARRRSSAKKGVTRRESTTLTSLSKRVGSLENFRTEQQGFNRHVQKHLGALNRAYGHRISGRCLPKLPSGR